MEKAATNLLKEYVMSQRFESTAQVMAAMKEMFAEVLQEAMSCELEEQLGYEKSERVSKDAVEKAQRNYRKRPRAVYPSLCLAQSR